MAYLDENGLQRFYNGVKAQIDAVTIQATDTNNDGNIVLSFPTVETENNNENN